MTSRLEEPPQEQTAVIIIVLSKIKNPLVAGLKLDGVAGIEPANVGIKIRCLTTWRHPNR